MAIQWKLELTDLSPGNIARGSTEPEALRVLSDAASTVRICHLPRLHAKAYVADDHKAIITSANLTAGGLEINYEYGAAFADLEIVGTVRNDISAYASLGADITAEWLDAYCVRGSGV